MNIFLKLILSRIDLKFYRQFGAITTLRMFFYRSIRKLTYIKFGSIKIIFRPWEKSDITGILDSIVQDINNESWIKALAKLKSQKRTIFFDLGSNIGLESVFVNERLDVVNFVLVEIDKENIEISKLNTFGLNVKFVNNAISAVSDLDLFFDNTKSKNSLVIQKDKNGHFDSVKSISITDLINSICIEDSEVYNKVVKMDIEGSEKEIFLGTADLDWLNKIDILYLEYHSFSDIEYQKLLDVLQTFRFYIIRTYDLWNYNGWGGILLTKSI